MGDTVLMKLKEIYDLAVKKGMKSDPRGEDEVKKLLGKAKEEYESLEGTDKEVFDMQRLENPYADSRILHGDKATEIGSVMIGVNIDTGEVVLADRLNEKGKKVDLIIGHHPRGKSLSGLHDVMHLQKDVLINWGVPTVVADSLMDKRIKEVERKVKGSNYNQSLDAAKLLDIPMMSIHTPTDNLVSDYLSKKVEDNDFEKVGDVLELLKEIPEYHESRKYGDGPFILVGDKDRRPGKVVVEMTGGTEGSKKSYEKLADAGVGTIIGMHLSDKHRKEVKENHLNYIIAGHMASDSIGINLFADELERNGVEIIPCSGFVRHSRNS